MRPPLYLALVATCSLSACHEERAVNPVIAEIVFDNREPVDLTIDSTFIQAHIEADLVDEHGVLWMGKGTKMVIGTRYRNEAPCAWIRKAGANKRAGPEFCVSFKPVITSLNTGFVPPEAPDDEYEEPDTVGRNPLDARNQIVGGYRTLETGPVLPVNFRLAIPVTPQEVTIPDSIARAKR